MVTWNVNSIRARHYRPGQFDSNRGLRSDPALCSPAAAATS